jgi:tetratricopeptide (TPR) repeat protein
MKVRLVKKLGIYAGILIVCAGLSACGDKEPTNIELGFEDINALKYDDAITVFDVAIENGENEKEALRGKALAYMGKGDYENAEATFIEALNSGGSVPKDIDYDINYYLGVCYYKMGRYDDSIARYDAIIDLRPKERDAYMQRGIARIAVGKINEAKEDFDTAISYSKKDNGIYIDIFNAFREAGLTQDGEVYLQQALDNNDSSMSKFDKGRIYFYLEDYTNARNFLEEARNEGEKGEDVILLLGQSYENLGDKNYAISLYDTYLATTPSAALYNQCAKCYIELKDYSDAVTYINNGLSQEDKSYDQQLRFNQIVCYEMMGDFETAKSLMATYIKDYPDDEVAARENKFLITR